MAFTVNCVSLLESHALLKLSMQMLMYLISCAEVVGAQFEPGVAALTMTIVIGNAHTGSMSKDVYIFDSLLLYCMCLHAHNIVFTYLKTITLEVRTSQLWTHL